MSSVILTFPSSPRPSAQSASSAIQITPLCALCDSDKNPPQNSKKTKPTQNIHETYCLKPHAPLPSLQPLCYNTTTMKNEKPIQITNDYKYAKKILWCCSCAEELLYQLDTIIKLTRMDTHNPNRDKDLSKYMNQYEKLTKIKNKLNRQNPIIPK